MPGRPPADWFARCVADVAASGHAVEPRAVCGATWARKTEREKRETIRTEEGRTMAAKKKGKKKGKKKQTSGAAARTPKRAKKRAPKHAKKRAKSGGGTHTKRASHRPAHRTARKTTKKVHHRCAACGHGARHDGQAGCLHQDRSGRFCDCKHR
jgi:hypothetical protein